jgi:hypothetical protein
MDVKDPSLPKPTTLYRFYDADDRLLYVGITEHLAHRTRDHRHGALWWDDAVRSTLERFPSRPEAKSAESRAILTEDPLHNKAERPVTKVSCVVRPKKRRSDALVTVDAELHRLAKARAAVEHRTLKSVVGELLAGYLVEKPAEAKEA